MQKLMRRYADIIVLVVAFSVWMIIALLVWINEDVDTQQEDRDTKELGTYVEQTSEVAYQRAVAHRLDRHQGAVARSRSIIKKRYHSAERAKTEAILAERERQRIAQERQQLAATRLDAQARNATTTRTHKGTVWHRLAQCESGGNWQINTGNGYYGGLQFSLSSWQWVGGTGYPHQASMAEQIKRAEILLSRGGWSHWPACSRKLGLR